MTTANRHYVDPADDALTDLEGILHALEIIRREDVFCRPGPELYALNVLIPLAVQKAEAVRTALEDAARAAKTKAVCQQVAHV